MRVRAKHWVKYNDAWHSAGEEFDIFDTDAEEMKAYAEVVAETEPAAEPEKEQAEEPEQDDAPAKRGRKRKAE